MKLPLFLFLFLVLTLSSVSAWNFETGNVQITQGNLTKLSELTDTNIPSPTDGYVLTYNSTSGKWYDASAAAVGDTNETDFVLALAATDCGAGYLVIGVYANGTVVCAEDQTGVAAYDDTWINNTIDTKIADNNASVNNYIVVTNGSVTNYIAENNQSVINYILWVNSTNGAGSGSYDDTWINNTIDTKISDNNASVTNWVTSTFVQIANIVDLVGNWSADKVNYYTKTEIDANNDSVNNYILYVNSTNGAGGTDTKWNFNGSYIVNDTTNAWVDEAYLNNTIDERIVSTYYNVTALSVVQGTGAGVLSDIQIYNFNSYNVTERALSPSLDFRMNFSGVDTFNEFLMRYKTDDVETHTMNLYLYNYGTSSWEILGPSRDVDSYTVFAFPVFDPDSFISGGVVQARALINTNGNTAHIHYFDWVTLVKGVTIASTQEVDPFSHHTDENINASNYNITTNYIFAKNWSNVTITTSQISDYSATTDTNETARFDNLTATDCGAGYLVIGVFDNGTVTCAQDTDTDTNTFNTTEEMQDAVGGALDGNFTYDDAGDSITVSISGMRTWLDGVFVSISGIVDQVGNWSADKVNYYTKTEVDDINTSMKNYVDWNNVSVQNHINSIADTNETARFDNLTAVDCGAGYKTIGVFDNGTIVCSEDIDTDTNTFNTTEEMQDAVGSGFGGNLTYNDGANTFRLNGATIRTWLDGFYVQLTGIVDQVGNWSADKVNYYTKTEVDNINTSTNNYIAENNNSVNNYIAAQDADDLETGTTFGGEVSGTYDNIVLDNDALDDQYRELGNKTFTQGINVTGGDVVYKQGTSICLTYDCTANMTFNGTHTIWY